MDENQLNILYILWKMSWFSLCQRSFDAGKLVGLQQIVARLVHTTLSVSQKTVHSSVIAHLPPCTLVAPIEMYD